MQNRKCRSPRVASAVLPLLCAFGLPAGADGLALRVEGVNAPATDWVARVELPREAVGAGTPVVRERDAQGGFGARCAATLLDGGGEGPVTLFWQMPGLTTPGVARSFVLGAPVESDAPAPADAVRVRREGDRIVVGNRFYEVVHDVKKGATIVEVLFRQSGKRLPVAMRDGVRGKEWLLLSGDDAPSVTVLGHESGALGAVIEVCARPAHPATPLEARPRALYRYTYSANSPVIRIDAALPAQETAQRFGQVQQFAFDWPGGKTFAKTERIVPSASGALMVTRFEWSADEHRPPAGFLMTDGPNAVALLNPVSGTFRLDAEAGHVVSRGYLESWQGERVALSGALCVGPSGEVEKCIPLGEGIVVRAAAPVLSGRIDALLRRAGPDAERRLIATLAEAARRRMAAQRDLDAVVELLAAADSRADRVASAPPPPPAPALAVLETKSFIVLANAHAGYLFRKRGTAVSLDGIFDADRGCLEPAWEDRPLWRAAWKLPGEAWAASSSLDAADVEIALDRPDARTVRLVLDWPSVTAGPERARARAEIALSADSPLARWTLSLDPTGDKLGLWEATFPIVGGIARDGVGADHLVFPYKSGTRVINPSAAGIWSNLYPGAAGWQFLAWWQGRSGLYLGAHDPGAATKKMESLPQAGGTLELRITHLVPGMGRPGTGARFDYDTLVGPFAGDWYDAVQIYRAWLLKQDWFPARTLHANEDTPKWLKETVVATRRSGTHGDFVEDSVEKHASGFQEWHTGVRPEFEALGKPATLLWWYHAWFKSADKYDESPDFPLPPNYREGLDVLRKMGLRVIAYTLSYWWGYDTPSWRAERADQAVCLRADGKPDIYDRRGVAIMCPATKLYQEKMQRVIRQLLKDGPVDGTYFDLGGTAGAYLCFATEHGHPVGSGEFITRGKRELMGGMRRAGREINPEFVLVMEGDADCYLTVTDGYPLFEENLPVRMALYGDYGRSAGSKRTYWEPKPMEGIVSAKQFAWGALIGRFIGADLNKGKDLAPEKTRHFATLVRAKRAALPWLNYGRMLRPVEIQSVTPAEPAEFVTGTLVPSAVWQAPDGSVAFVFANARHSTDVEFRYALAPAAYGIAADGSMALYRLTPAGEEAAPEFTKVAEVRGPLDRTEKLDPSGVLILVARPTR